MELRHIRYFVAVAEELNFTRAAARLGIGQPPLSQQIKDLEVELGVPLLRRLPHGAELTAAGAIFLEEGRRTLVASESAVQAARRAARGETGRLRLGFTGSAHFNTAVPFSIRAFGRRYPDAELRLEEANTHMLLALLDSGEIDVAFTHSGLEDLSKVHMHPVEDEALVVVLPRDHPCAAETSVPLAALRDDPFVMKPPHVAPELHKATMEVCRAAGFEPTVGQEAPQVATVISLVAATLGVSLVPASMQHIRASGVVYRPIKDGYAQVSLSLVWRRHERSQAVQNFIALVREGAWREQAG